MKGKTKANLEGAYLDKEELVPVRLTLDGTVYSVKAISQDCPECWEYLEQELETQRLNNKFYEMFPEARKYFQRQ